MKSLRKLLTSPMGHAFAITHLFIALFALFGDSESAVVAYQPLLLQLIFLVNIPSLAVSVLPVLLLVNIFGSNVSGDVVLIVSAIVISYLQWLFIGHSVGLFLEKKGLFNKENEYISLKLHLKA